MRSHRYQGWSDQRDISTGEESVKNGYGNGTPGSSGSENRKCQDTSSRTHEDHEVEVTEVVCEEVGGDTTKDRGGVQDSEEVK